MTPQIVHRYSFAIRDAVEALLGDAVGDCEAWRIRVEADEVVVDVVAPMPSIAPTLDELTEGFRNSQNQAFRDENINVSKPSGYDSEASNETAKNNAQDPDLDLKGGPLARKAAIRCGERGFQTFLGVSNPDAAKADICRRCGITTRKMLDHDNRAADIWREIDLKYNLWLEGFDVKL